MKRTLCILLVSLVAACSRSTQQNATEGGAAAPAAGTAAPAVREAKDLLADAKVIAGYATYQQEIAPHTKAMMTAFAAIAAKTGRDPKKMEEAAKNDPRVVEFNKANQAALAKAGLSDGDVRTVGSALSSYMAEAYVAKGTPDEKAQLQAADDKLAAAYGPAALSNVRQHRDALLAAQDAVMKAMMK